MSRSGYILLLLGLSPLLPGTDVTWQGVSIVRWHDNVTNGDRNIDRVPATEWRTDLVGMVLRALPGRNTMTAGLHLGLITWPEFPGLDSFSAGPDLALAHKFGLGPQAWIIRAAARGDLTAVRESGRSSHAHEFRLELSRRWGASWRLTTGMERERLHARFHAFSHSGRANFIHAEYQASERWLIRGELRQRAGIVVSYTTPPRPDLVAAGKELSLVGTFKRAEPLLAYYFPADTTSALVEAVRSLGPATALTLQAEYRDTTHGSLRYRNRRWGLGLMHRW